MSSTQTFDVGSNVVFTGFTSDELPDNSELLEEGQEYVVVETKQEGDDAEMAYLLEVQNPNFDSKKRASKANPKTLKIDVFSDEIKLADIGDDEEETEAPAKAKAKKATAKKAPAKKAATKKASVKKAPPPEEEEEEEASEEAAELAFEDLSKGMQVTVYDPEDGSTMLASGTITSKTKRSIKIVDENGEETIIPPDSLFYSGAYEIEEEMEEAEEEDPELKGMLILSEDEEDEDILELVNETDDICELAHEMSEESASLDYRLGGVLYHVRLSGAYKSLDDRYAEKGGFMAYIEEQLPVGYRKAMYLIDIYTKWRKYDLDVEKVQQIGWTKAQEIARVMTAENAEDLVKLAEDSTVSDLKDTIKETYSGGTKEREAVKKITFKFRLTEEAGVNVRDFFEQAKDDMGLENDNEVFEHIVTQWATDHLNIKKVGRTKKTAAKKAA